MLSMPGAPGRWNLYRQKTTGLVFRTGLPLHGKYGSIPIRVDQVIQVVIAHISKFFHISLFCFLFSELFRPIPIPDSLTMHMQTRILFSMLLPTTSGRRGNLHRVGCAGTRGTANADKSAVMQYVIGNFLVVDIALYFFSCPMQYRVVFNDLVARVVFEDFQVLAGR